MLSDGVITVSGDTRCADVERAALPWLFASDTPGLTVAEWIDRGGGDLLWGLLGPTRAQVLGVAAELPNGAHVRFGGRVVKNVAGYDLARVFVGARGELGRITQAHLRVRPPPRLWRAAVREGTDRDEAKTGAGCAVWNGATFRFLRLGEPTPDGYQELAPGDARTRLRGGWQRVVSFHKDRDDRNRSGIVLAGPGVVGSKSAEPPARGPLWATLRAAWS